jgi:hypothetical protein
MNNANLVISRRSEWICDDCLRVKDWMACFDHKSGNIFWDHRHSGNGGDYWTAVEFNGPGSVCGCGEAVPESIMRLAQYRAKEVPK